jgi:Trypsin-like peptidase domain
MQIQTFADQLYFTTVRLTATDGSESWAATSFVYAVQTERGTAHFLLTNKHVVQEATRIVFSGVKGEGGSPRLGEAAEVAVDSKYERDWNGHPDDDIDVAAAPFWNVLQELSENEQVGMFFRSVPPEFSLTPEREQELDSVEDVIFVGYPSGIFDAVNLLPVVRRGITATPIAVDYNGIPAFLVDASVFPGSSGSPVFLAETGTYRSRDGGLVVGTRGMCLGILAAVHVRTVEGNVTELVTRLEVTFDEPIDLGIVYKSSVFDACVDPLLARAGLARVATAPMPPGEDRTPADEQLAESADSTP